MPKDCAIFKKIEKRTINLTSPLLPSVPGAAPLSPSALASVCGSPPGSWRPQRPSWCPSRLWGLTGRDTNMEKLSHPWLNVVLTRGHSVWPCVGRSGADGREGKPDWGRRLAEIEEDGGRIKKPAAGLCDFHMIIWV